MNNEIEITTHVQFKSSESHDSPFAGYKAIDVVFKMPVKELLSPKIIIIAEDSKFVFINEPLMSNNGICNKIANEFINQTIKRVSSHRKVCR